MSDLDPAVFFLCWLDGYLDHGTQKEGLQPHHVNSIRLELERALGLEGHPLFADRLSSRAAGPGGESVH